MGCNTSSDSKQTTTTHRRSSATYVPEATPDADLAVHCDDPAFERQQINNASKMSFLTDGDFETPASWEPSASTSRKKKRCYPKSFHPTGPTLTHEEEIIQLAEVRANMKIFHPPSYPNRQQTTLAQYVAFSDKDEREDAGDEASAAPPKVAVAWTPENADLCLGRPTSLNLRSCLRTTTTNKDSSLNHSDMHSDPSTRFSSFQMDVDGESTAVVALHTPADEGTVFCTDGDSNGEVMDQEDPCSAAHLPGGLTPSSGRKTVKFSLA